MNPQDQSRIDLCLHGISGYAQSARNGWSLHGKWASHTGYRYVVSKHHEDALGQIAEAWYRVHQPLCYLVGDEHRDMGWKTHQVNHQGGVQIRLPEWADQSITQALSQLGLQLADPLNRYWVFESSVTLSQAREVLAPLLAPATRLADEGQLARELRTAYQRSAVCFEQRQMELF